MRRAPRRLSSNLGEQSYALISILRGFAASCFGSWTFRTPFSNRAFRLGYVRHRKTGCNFWWRLMYWLRRLHNFVDFGFHHFPVRLRLQGEFNDADDLAAHIFQSSGVDVDVVQPPRSFLHFELFLQPL